MMLSVVMMKAQSPSCSWQRSLGTNYGEYANKIYSDKLANCYLAGAFGAEDIIVGPDTLPNFGLINSLFVKYSGTGTIVWAKGIHGTGGDYGNDIAAEADGTSFVTGVFYNGGITIDSILLNNSGGKDIYLAKLDGYGNVIWARAIGGAGDDLGSYLGIDTIGNVYLAGYFQSDTLLIDSTILVNHGGTTTFLAKFDSLGNLVWARQSGGSSPNFIGAITTDPQGNSFISGYFTGSTTTFGTVVLNNSNSASPDIYLVKYNSLGTVDWAKKFGGFSSDFISGIAVDTLDQPYITGWSESGNLYFDTIAIHNLNCPAYIFVAKCDAAGNALWVRHSTGASYDRTGGIALDNAGNAFVTGSFQSQSMVLDSITIFNSNPSGGSYDAFTLKYNKYGNIIWAKKAGFGTQIEQGTCVSSDPGGICYVGGYFDGIVLNYCSSSLWNVHGGWEDLYLIRINNLDVGLATYYLPEDGFEIFPTASDGIFNLEIPGNDHIQVEIYSAIGEHVLSFTTENSKTQIDLKNAAAGIYFVRVIIEGRMVAKKIVKQ